MESQNDGILKKISSYKSVDMGKVGSVRVAKKKTWINLGSVGLALQRTLDWNQKTFESKLY